MDRKNNQLPYMNRELRKAIYNKKMYYSKFLKDKSSKNWEQYRLGRNLVNKLKRKSEIFISDSKVSYISFTSISFVLVFDCTCIFTLDRSSFKAITTRFLKLLYLIFCFSFAK
jgi:hypothetical protein